MADNPIRIGYVPGWTSINDLIERLEGLECAIGKQRVVPAHWEPSYADCPCCRDATAYAWAGSQLGCPAGVSLAAALFSYDGQHPNPKIGCANHLLLCAKREESCITKELMVAEALEIWNSHADIWLQEVVDMCARLGFQSSVSSLRSQVQEELSLLSMDSKSEGCVNYASDITRSLPKSHGFDAELLHMDGWTPNPGMVVLPVDGPICSLAKQILLLDLQNVVLFKGKRRIRLVPWDKVTLVHIFEDAVTFETIDEAPLVVAGYRNPDRILQTIEEFQKAATERVLQRVATHLLRPTP